MGSEGPKKIKLPAERTLGSSQFPKGTQMRGECRHEGATGATAEGANLTP